MPPLWIDSPSASPAGSRLSIRISAVERYPRNSQATDTLPPPCGEGGDAFASIRDGEPGGGQFPLRLSIRISALRRYLRDSYPQPVEMWISARKPKLSCPRASRRTAASS